MKNIVFWSREMDLMIGFLALAAVVGYCLPVIYQNGWWPLNGMGSLMAVGIGVFAWALFEIIKPTRIAYGWRHWRIAELWVVPTVWVLLVATFVIFFHVFQKADDNQVRLIMEKIDIASMHTIAD